MPGIYTAEAVFKDPCVLFCLRIHDLLYISLLCVIHTVYRSITMGGASLLKHRVAPAQCLYFTVYKVLFALVLSVTQNKSTALL